MYLTSKLEEVILGTRCRVCAEIQSSIIWNSFGYNGVFFKACTIKDFIGDTIDRPMSNNIGETISFKSRHERKYRETVLKELQRVTI